MPPDGSILAVDRDARKVTHMLVRPRELVEEGGLAAVLVTGERKGKGRPLRDRRLARMAGAHVAYAALAYARVGHGVRGR